MSKKIYNSAEDCNRIILAIRDQIYSAIPESIRPSKEEFITSFDRKCGTRQLVNILDKISDDLNGKV